MYRELACVCIRARVCVCVCVRVCACVCHLPLPLCSEGQRERIGGHCQHVASRCPDGAAVKRHRIPVRSILRLPLPHKHAHTRARMSVYDLVCDDCLMWSISVHL